MIDLKRHRRIGLIVAGVLGAHAWLLTAAPHAVVPEKSAPSWIARTLPIPAAVAAQETAKVHPAVPPARPQAQPRRQAPRKSPPAEIGDVAAAQVERTPSTPSQSEPSLQTVSTHASGAAPAMRFTVPRSARFNYDVVAHAKGFTLNGNARLDWRNDGREYEAELVLSAPLLPTRTQRSTGHVTPQGLAPVRFSDKVRSEEATHFDRENNKVVFSTNKPEAPLEPGVQDRLSIIMQLAAMLAGEPSRYPAGSRITVQTASTKEAEPWTFTVDAPEALSLPGGRVQAVRLTRLPRKEFDQKVELWLAPGAAYAPVRLRLTQPNGDWVDQQWSSTDRG